MWAKIGFFLLAVLAIYIGIALLVKFFPQIFRQKNLDTLRRASGNMFVPQGAFGRTLGLTLGIPVAIMGVTAVVEFEQKRLLGLKIRELENKIVAKLSKGIIYFISLRVFLDEKLSLWKRQIAIGEFEHLSLLGEVDDLARKLKDFWPVISEIEVLLADNFQLLEKVKQMQLPSEINGEVGKLEQALREYQKITIDFDSLAPFVSLGDDLKQINTLLKQIMMMDSELQNKIEPKKDYYIILGLKKNASQEEIKKAYRALAIKFHPDKKRSQLEKIDDEDMKARIEEEYNRMLADINEAYGILLDVQKREEYDRTFSSSTF